MDLKDIKGLDELISKTISEQMDLVTGKLKESQTEWMAKVAAAQRQAAVPAGEKGLSIATCLRAIAFAKGDMNRAANAVKNTYGDNHPAYKALTASDAAGGGFLIPPEMAAELIELLRSRAVVRSMNPIVLPMPKGVLPLNRLSGGATASYVGESTNIPGSQQTFEQQVLTWKKLVALVPISKELLDFSSQPGGQAADQVVRDDLLAALAVREDLAFIRGDGLSNTPKGLRNHALAANVTASNGTTLAQVRQDLRELVNALEQADVRMLRPGFLMSPRSKNYLMFDLTDGNGNVVFRDELLTGRLNGMPVGVTTAIPNNLGGGTESEVYLADFADVVIGDSQMIELEESNEASYIDPATSQLVSAFSRDEIVMKATARHDMGMRHVQSIAVKTGVTWGA